MAKVKLPVYEIVVDRQQLTVIRRQAQLDVMSCLTEEAQRIFHQQALQSTALLSSQNASNYHIWRINVQDVASQSQYQTSHHSPLNVVEFCQMIRMSPIGTDIGCQWVWLCGPVHDHGQTFHSVACCPQEWPEVASVHCFGAVIYGSDCPVLIVDSSWIDLPTNEQGPSSSKNAFSLIQPEMRRPNCQQDVMDMQPVFS